MFCQISKKTITVNIDSINYLKKHIVIEANYYQLEIGYISGKSLWLDYYDKVILEADMELLNLKLRDIKSKGKDE